MCLYRTLINANKRINVLPLYTLCRYGKSSGFLMFLKLFTATCVYISVVLLVCFGHSFLVKI